jgi:hypothetical protein
MPETTAGCGPENSNIFYIKLCEEEYEEIFGKNFSQS